MTQFNYGQLETLWIQAGGSKSLAPLMAAIALAESAGRSDNNNYSDNGGTQTSWGLWQISDGTHNMPVSNIDDPLVNAQQAVLKEQTQGLSAWGTYTSGAYQQFYKGSVPPAVLTSSSSSGSSGPSGGGGGSFWGDIWKYTFHIIEGTGLNLSPGQSASVVDGNANPLAALGAIGADIASIAHDFHMLFTISSWLFKPSSWLRIGAFIVGLLTLGGAAYMFKEAL